MEQKLTMEQLRFARSIGAVYCVDCDDGFDECEFKNGALGKPGFVYRDGWVKWKHKENGRSDLVSLPEERFEIDYSPLDAEEEKPDLKYDQGKPLFGLIPPEAELMEAQVLTFGAQKYEPNSWREIKDAERRYMDAMLRHINAIKSGETHDPESGLPHIAHVRTNSGFLCALMDTEK